jgi:uncharacterized Zn-finger protein
VVYDGERTLALQCPACQGVQFHVFYVFEISHRPHPLQCKCGFTHGQIRRSSKRYLVDAFSLAGERVRLTYSAREFLRATLVPLIEPTFGDIVGYLGKNEEVAEAVAYSDALSEAGSLPSELEQFENPDVMFAILSHLQQLAGMSKVACQCDHPSVGIDIYSDKVELVCSYCGSAMLIGASTEADLQRVLSLSEIVMEPSSYASLGERLRPIF